MLDKFKQLYQLRKQAKDVQRQLEQTEVEAKSNDGSVRVVFNGQQKIVELELSADSLRPENKTHLEKTLKETITQSISQTQKVAAERSKEMMKGMGLDLPGM